MNRPDNEQVPGVTRGLLRRLSDVRTDTQDWADATAESQALLDAEPAEPTTSLMERIYWVLMQVDSYHQGIGSLPNEECVELAKKLAPLVFPAEPAEPSAEELLAWQSENRVGVFPYDTNTGTSWNACQWGVERSRWGDVSNIEGKNAATPRDAVLAAYRAAKESEAGG